MLGDQMVLQAFMQERSQNSVSSLADGSSHLFPVGSASSSTSGELCDCLKCPSSSVSAFATLPPGFEVPGCPHLRKKALLPAH
mmetsp:Transcript_104434/g.185711  ORF Transcript_104434/g.185711 Transcript_104434/m.185711 type:complete len:83 (+) Transcript_104434:187-435(+)